MRVLLTHRYYHPDSTTQSQTLRLLAQRLLQDGHDVSVFASQPNYNDIYQGPVRAGRNDEAGIRVHRARIPTDRGRGSVRRMAHMLWFSIRLTLHGLLVRRRYDLILVSTTPPILMGVAGRFITALRGGKYIIHGLDIYPEIARISGFMQKGVAYRWLRRIDAANYDKALAAVVLSEDMRRALAARGSAVSHVRVINNMILDDTTGPDSADVVSHADDPTFRIVFAGNLGRFQSLETVVDAAHQLQAIEIEFVFMGAGKAREELVDRAGSLVDQTVRFLDHRPLRDAIEFIATCDLALITLAPEIINYAYPSKLMSYLQAGRRVLVVVEEDSELAEFISAENLGSTCPPGQVPALVAAIHREHALGRQDESEALRIRAVGQEYFGRIQVLSMWASLFRELEKETAQS